MAHLWLKEWLLADKSNLFLRMGNVINAITGAKGSTTLNKRLLEQAKLAALKTKFESKPTAPLKQQGKIIYSFRLN